MASTTEPQFDEPEFYLGDPHATFTELREHDPVHWYEDGGFWVITRYDDIRFISTHPGTFSSRRVAILADLVARRKGTAPEDPGHRGIMFMDPPEHTKHRKAVGVRFTPRVVGQLDDDVRNVIRAVLDGLPAGAFDWIEHVAEPIPVFVFSRLLGVPESDWGKVSGWATTIAAVGGGQASDEDIELIFGEIGPYLFDLAMKRKDDPTDDLLTMLGQIEIDGEPFDDSQVVTYALTLLAAGSETTQSLIAGLADSLDQHPDQAERAFADAELAGGAIEETLRWWTPVLSMARSATEAIELGGQTIEPGQGMLLEYASANRDRDKWGDDADVYDITRADASHHLGFGFGEHFCLGAHLARREARILMEELSRRASGIRVAGERVPRRSALVHTHDSLRVQLVP
jgi:cytochrome P450